jgi:glycerate 2-kinase
MADLKQIARRIFHETLAAIDVPAAMGRKVRREVNFLHACEHSIDLRPFARVRVIAIGKAAHPMVQGLLAILRQHTAGRQTGAQRTVALRDLAGIVSAPVPPPSPITGWKYFVGGHPIPNGESWRAAEAILASLRDCDEETLVFFLFSGGGSALVEMPLDPRQTLEDVQELHRVLVTCGAPIDAINTVRKHISAVKGGRLAVAAGSATKITLAVSDVPVGKESAIASGPTLPDPTTVGDVHDVIAKYSLRERLPVVLQRWIAEGKMPETPKAGDHAFSNAPFSLLLGTDDLFHPAHRAAEAQGFFTCCDNATDDWPVGEAAEYLLQQLAHLQRLHPGRCVALLADGEVSSRVTGKGIGGRNSAFVLACVEKIAGKRIAVLSAGTDGMDGNSPAAGATADGVTLARAHEQGADVQEAMRQSDAYSFFSRLDDAIVIGPTGNNLRDLRILLAEP